VARTDRIADPSVRACGSALLGLSDTVEGRTALQLLYLDGVAPPNDTLFDGIAARMAVLVGG